MVSAMDADSTLPGPIEHVIPARPRDIAGFPVGRVLPSVPRRRVGPFVFLDHMGPVTLGPGAGLDVPPHPHIGLATVTYLFDGEIVHRDTIGSLVRIRPGDVNWMFAGRGIAHSERSDAAWRERGGRIHGLQCWVAVPTEHEHDAPRFEHHDGAALPSITLGGVVLRVVAGNAYGRTSPVGVSSPTLYVDALLPAGAEHAVDDGHEERAVYVVEGEIECGGHRAAAGTLLVLRPGIAASLRAHAASRAMLLGGAPLIGARHMWWNFVATDLARIEQAKDDWRHDRFGTITGEHERIALPER